MHTFFSVLKDFIHFFNVRTIIGRIRLAVLASIAVVVVYFLAGGTQADVESVKQERAVVVASVSFFSDSVSTQLVGAVSSIDQAIIQAESSGRVTSVEVILGQSVAAGQVIVRLENASEFAAVLQAEGAYEGTFAAAQISDVSVFDAENNLTSERNSAYASYASAYSTLLTIYQNDLDLIVADPEDIFRTPGVRLQATGKRINEVDTDFKSIGVLVSEQLVPDTTVLPISELLTDAQASGEIMMQLINNLQFLIGNDELNEAYTATELAYLSRLNSAQSKVNTLISSLKASEDKLYTAKAVLTKAELGGTSGVVSSANAQIKQALGSLRAAQANYNKTILRSPIAGVVNSLGVQTGDFVSGFQTVAEVANNDALEITTFVGQSDRALLETQQEVRIEGGILGVVSAIAPAVNTATGKIEVQIQSTSPDLLNGDTVIITLDSQVDAAGDTTIQVPLTAVKFTASAGIVYSVADGVLLAHDVTIGPVRDVYIEILSGISPDMEIVVDARGLNEGERVTVVAN
jgi:RND family efflux transporter MFP subunit